MITRDRLSVLYRSLLNNLALLVGGYATELVFCDKLWPGSTAVLRITYEETLSGMRFVVNQLSQVDKSKPHHEAQLSQVAIRQVEFFEKTKKAGLQSEFKEVLNLEFIPTFKGPSSRSVSSTKFNVTPA